MTFAWPNVHCFRLKFGDDNPFPPHTQFGPLNYAYSYSKMVAPCLLSTIILQHESTVCQNLRNIFPLRQYSRSCLFFFFLVTVLYRH